MALPNTMSVQVKKGSLRSSPSFIGKIVAEVAYGDRMEIQEEKAGWVRGIVLGKGVGGWIHSSALSVKRIVLKAGATNVQKGVSDGELALAGKGFNRQVEGEFKNRHRNIDFSPIDEMERIVISAGDVRKFLDDGGLNPEGGIA